MEKVFASSVAVLDSNVYTGGGTDVTKQLQAVLDRAVDGNGIHLVMDGAALVSGLKVHSNTTIECVNSDCGFYQRDYANRPIFTNADWDLRKIKNHDITFLGGTYNHNCTHQDHDVPVSEYPYPEVQMANQEEFTTEHGIYLMEFYGVENFAIKGVKFKNQRTYTLSMGNFLNVVIEDSAIDMAVHVTPSNQDGFHFFGPGQFLSIRNVRGCTGDDFLNLAPDEFDGVSSITDVLIDGVFLDNTCQGIRMLSIGTGVLDRVTVKNVTGTYRTFGFSIIPFYVGENFGSYGDIYFENINLRQIDTYYHHTPMTLFQTGGNISCMTLKNVRFHNPVRNNVMFDIGRPFFYRPLEMTQEEATAYGIDYGDEYSVQDWIPEVARPHIKTFIIDGLTVTNGEKADGTEIMELKYQIDNLVLKNVQIFRSQDAQPSGHLIKMSKEAKVKNMILEDVFAEKLDSILCATQENKVDLLVANNVTLREGNSLYQVPDEVIRRTFDSGVRKVD